MTDGNNAELGSIHGATPKTRLLTGMDELIKQRQKGFVHYTQSSKRMTIVRKHLIPPFHSAVIWEDCSSAATGLYFMAGLHDPNELHFNGTGYTGTLVLHGSKVSSPYEIGDLVFYGDGGVPHHVAIVHSAVPGQSVKVWSHGHEGGPVIEPIDYRSDRSQVRRYF